MALKGTAKAEYISNISIHHFDRLIPFRVRYGVFMAVILTDEYTVI